MFTYTHNFVRIFNMGRRRLSMSNIIQSSFSRIKDAFSPWGPSFSEREIPKSFATQGSEVKKIAQEIQQLKKEIDEIPGGSKTPSTPDIVKQLNREARTEHNVALRTYRVAKRTIRAKFIYDEDSKVKKDRPSVFSGKKGNDEFNKVKKAYRDAKNAYEKAEPEHLFIAKLLNINDSKEALKAYNTGDFKATLDALKTEFKDLLRTSKPQDVDLLKDRIELYRDILLKSLQCELHSKILETKVPEELKDLTDKRNHFNATVEDMNTSIMKHTFVDKNIEANNNFRQELSFVSLYRSVANINDEISKILESTYNSGLKDLWMLKKLNNSIKDTAIPDFTEKVIALITEELKNPQNLAQYKRLYELSILQSKAEIFEKDPTKNDINSLEAQLKNTTDIQIKKINNLINDYNKENVKQVPKFSNDISIDSVADLTKDIKKNDILFMLYNANRSIAGVLGKESDFDKLNNNSMHFDIKVPDKKAFEEIKNKILEIREKNNDPNNPELRDYLAKLKKDNIEVGVYVGKERIKEFWQGLSKGTDPSLSNVTVTSADKSSSTPAAPAPPTPAAPAPAQGGTVTVPTSRDPNSSPLIITSQGKGNDETETKVKELVNKAISELKSGESQAPKQASPPNGSLQDSATLSLGTVAESSKASARLAAMNLGESSFKAVTATIDANEAALVTAAMNAFKDVTEQMKNRVPQALAPSTKQLPNKPAHVVHETPVPVVSPLPATVASPAPVATEAKNTQLKELKQDAKLITSQKDVILRKILKAIDSSNLGRRGDVPPIVSLLNPEAKSSLQPQPQSQPSSKPIPSSVPQQPLTAELRELTDMIARREFLLNKFEDQLSKKGEARSADENSFLEELKKRKDLITTSVERIKSLMSEYSTEKAISTGPEIEGILKKLFTNPRDLVAVQRRIDEEANPSATLTHSKSELNNSQTRTLSKSQ